MDIPPNESVRRSDTRHPPRLSVCVITYNQAPYIAQCLDSILAQRPGCDFEIIVADDASSDGTRDIVEAYARRYPGTIRAILSERNGGPTVNYFRAHEAALGELVAHMDGDDYMLPDKLRRQVEVLDAHPECAMCVHEVHKWQEHLACMSDAPFFSGHIPVDAHGVGIVDFAFLAAHFPFFSHSSKMYRRTAAAGLRYEGEEMIDCHWHAYHASRGHIAFLNEPLSVYRVGIGVSIGAQARRGSMLMPRLTTSWYVQQHFDTAVDYAARLGAPVRLLRRSQAMTYLGWSLSFGRAGDLSSFCWFAKRSWDSDRLGLKQRLVYWLSTRPRAAMTLLRYAYRIKYGLQRGKGEQRALYA